MSAFATEHFRRVDAVFDAVLDLPTTEQAAYIDRACAGDAELRDDARLARTAAAIDSVALSRSALANGYGSQHVWTRSARSLADSLAKR